MGRWVLRQCLGPGLVVACLGSSQTAFAQCPPGVVPQPEVCNNFDDDCDGQLNEDPTGSEVALCPPKNCGQFCVEDEHVWLCADRQACHGNEFACQSGHVVADSEFEQVCVPLLEKFCPDCEFAMEKTASGEVSCAPAGTVLADDSRPPVCVCKGVNGCREPCYDVACTPDSICTNYGANAGRCVLPNCYNVPCPAGAACLDSVCVDNPCKVGTCPADQVCKPDSTFTGYQCTPTCGSVSCPLLQRCIDGECWPRPCPTCPASETCDPNLGQCVPSHCPLPYCADGSWCEPLTGACGAGPCEGVVCPSGEVCRSGECWDAPSPPHDAGPETGGSDASDGGIQYIPDATDDSDVGDAGGLEDAADGRGGIEGETLGSSRGCSCSSAIGARGSTSKAFVWVMLALASLRRRRGVGAATRPRQSTPTGAGFNSKLRSNDSCVAISSPFPPARLLSDLATTHNQQATNPNARPNPGRRGRLQLTRLRRVRSHRGSSLFRA